MKKFYCLAAAVVLLVQLAACGNAPAAASPASVSEASVSSNTVSALQEEEINTEVYRGRVAAMLEDGSIEVEQMEGYNYGQPSIVFHLAEGVASDEAGGSLQQDAYVEVYYNGRLTRSMPPQGTAQSLTVVAGHSEGIVYNGTIQSVQHTDDGYTIQMLPMEAESSALESQVILLVPADGLEQLTEEDLTEGTVISAVTHGIAALSLPPQLPVHVLLPYQP